MNKIILISFFTILNSLAQTSDSSMIEFNWKGIGNFNATLFVPDNYHQNDEYYGEGIFTTLTYEDSSCIFLHIGGCMQIPIMKEDVIVQESIKDDSCYIRKGISKNTKLYWRENNCRNDFINIGYSGVSKDKLKEFEKSIESFILLKR